MKSFVRSSRVRLVAATLMSLSVIAGGSATLAGASSATARSLHHGGTLTIAVGTNPPTLNFNVSDYPSVEAIQRLYGNYLFNLTGKDELVPSLATSYTESKNGLTYTINLRHGVHWSDGMLFTSKDVVFTLDKFLSVNSLVPATLAKDVTSVKAAGTYKAIVQLKQPFAPFMIGLTGSTLFMEPQHVYGNQTVVKDSAANDQPIGTGPFIVKQWIQNQKIVFVRNPHYWAAGKKNLPYFSGVVVDIVTNPQTMVDGLLSGTIDYVPTSFLPPSSIKSVMQSSCCRAVLTHGTPVYDLMYTNTTRPPFDNRTVRRAVYMALTRKLLIQDGLSGFGNLPLAPIPPSYAQLYTPKINLMKQYPYDPSKAAKMLDNAGFTVKNGERFGKAIQLLYSPTTGTFSTETVRAVKAELARITVNVNLVSLDRTSWETLLYVKHNFTLAFGYFTSANDPAFGIARMFVCQPTHNATYTNASGYCKKNVTSLFRQAATATTTAGRQRIYAEVQKVVDSDLPSYELGWHQTYAGVSKKVQNWKVTLLSWGGNFNPTWSQSWFK
jgi:peptide/nickel transport system substrate-binding protein